MKFLKKSPRSQIEIVTENLAPPKRQVGSGRLLVTLNLHERIPKNRRQCVHTLVIKARYNSDLVDLRLVQNPFVYLAVAYVFRGISGQVTSSEVSNCASAGGAIRIDMCEMWRLRKMWLRLVSWQKLRCGRNIAAANADACVEDEASALLRQQRQWWKMRWLRKMSWKMSVLLLRIKEDQNVLNSNYSLHQVRVLVVCQYR